MNPLQSRAYAKMLTTAQNEGFSHVMFLDIDEFWVPLGFKKSISATLMALGDPDIAYFERKNKVSDTQEFGRPFQPEIRVEPHPFPKCIVKTGINVKLENSHGVIYRGDSPAKISPTNVTGEAFVLHRFQRSQCEYLAMLGRGDPKFLGEFGLKFNRSGYISENTGQPDRFDQALIDRYDDLYNEFVASNDLSISVAKAKEFVRSRQIAMVDYMERHVASNRRIIKLTKGIDAYFRPGFPNVVRGRQATNKPAKHKDE